MKSKGEKRSEEDTKTDGGVMRKYDGMMKTCHIALMHIFFSMEWKSQTAESHKLTSENVDTKI